MREHLFPQTSKNSWVHGKEVDSKRQGRCSLEMKSVEKPEGIKTNSYSVSASYQYIQQLVLKNLAIYDMRQLVCRCHQKLCVCDNQLSA